jgi:outer membrane lipopolysaccharide assembly protein LptE/RlpB
MIINKMMFKIFLIAFVTLTISCGFKVIDKSMKDFSIKEIRTNGEKRINYKIKNNILSTASSNNNHVLLINLETKKNKEIKEKNIKNQTTKYQITINVNLKFNDINNKIKGESNFSSTGDYLVVENYSNTLNNEKRLIETLTENISQRILNKINSKINDL